jgi:tetratricopeptide (TPR) repeat protein
MAITPPRALRSIRWSPTQPPRLTCAALRSTILGAPTWAKELYGEALAAFDQLDALLASAEADPAQFGQKEHFLRAEALLGMGRYADAVTAYGQFLEAYPG